MSDQITTIAAFPAGFATLAGLIYAVIGPVPKIRSHTCWSRFRLRTPLDMIHPDYIEKEIEPEFAQSTPLDLEDVCYRFARMVTRDLQGYRGDARQDESIAEKVAILHLLTWVRRKRRIQPRTSLPPVAQQAGASTTSSSSRSTSTLAGNAPTQNSSPSGPSNSSPSNQNVEININVNMVDHERNWTMILVTVKKNELPKMFPNILSQQFNGLDEAFNAPSGRTPPNTVFAQAAAPWDVFMTELGFKGIELLFAAGVVLGSTGASWFALTLASMFPQRVAAGLYVSSFGQKMTGKMIEEADDVHVEFPFIAPGTLWVDDSNAMNNYCVRPCLRRKWFSDPVRDCVFYLLQYCLIHVLTWYKMELRATFFSDQYRKTVDTVRYVVLVIVPCVLLVCFLRMRSKRREKRRIVFLIIYIVTWAFTVVCMVFGQNELDRIWRIKYDYINRLVNPAAAIGAIAAVNYRAVGSKRGVDPDQWGLIWAIGVSTVVW